MKDEIDWLRRFLNASVFGPPPSEIQRAHAIVDRLVDSPGEANSEAEHLRMQIGYIVTQLMMRGDQRTLPEIVEEAAKATAPRPSLSPHEGGK